MNCTWFVLLSHQKLNIKPNEHCYFCRHFLYAQNKYLSEIRSRVYNYGKIICKSMCVCVCVCVCVCEHFFHENPVTCKLMRKRLEFVTQMKKINVKSTGLSSGHVTVDRNINTENMYICEEACYYIPEYMYICMHKHYHIHKDTNI